jgi:hypothetical protein
VRHMHLPPTACAESENNPMLSPNKPLCTALCAGCGDDISDDLEEVSYCYAVLPIDTSNVYPELVEAVIGTGITPSMCFSCILLLSTTNFTNTGLRDWKICSCCGINTANDDLAFRVTEVVVRGVETHMLSLYPHGGEVKDHTLLATEPASDGMEGTVCLTCMSALMEDSADGEIDDDRPLTGVYTYATDIGAWTG